MIQCRDCEYFEQDENGRRTFRCDPFTCIKEPECLMKWQLLRLDLLVSHYQNMLLGQQKMAPLQEKILKYMKRELDDMEDADRWKFEEPDEPYTPPEEEGF
ncbi:MAG: hypothetical protein JRF72_09385 [Deltaproteobacteria bacterium]|jgi:hypothetical protein|nr:hypothetical protein [Deltaproteobacteria bacterium]